MTQQSRTTGPVTTARRLVARLLSEESAVTTFEHVTAGLVLAIVIAVAFAAVAGVLVSLFRRARIVATLSTF